MDSQDGFWQRLEELVSQHGIVIDRPVGSRHPRIPSFVYPLDYGYLDGVRSVDGSDVDVWIGSLPQRHVTGIVCTVDSLKQEVELKILVSCTSAEARTALGAHNAGSQAAILLVRSQGAQPTRGESCEPQAEVP